MRHLIVIPAYNEEEALPQTVARLQRLPAGFEILIVNDGSILVNDERRSDRRQRRLDLRQRRYTAHPLAQPYCRWRLRPERR